MHGKRGRDRYLKFGAPLSPRAFQNPQSIHPSPIPIDTGLLGRNIHSAALLSHHRLPHRPFSRPPPCQCHGQAKPESISFHLLCPAAQRQLRQLGSVARVSHCPEQREEGERERDRRRERESFAAACLPRLASSTRRAKQEIEDSKRQKRYQQLICQKVKGGRKTKRGESPRHATPV